ASLSDKGFEDARKNIELLTTIFGRKNVYVELQRHCDVAEERRNQAAVRLAETMGLPFLATNGVRYATPAEREILDVFTCIRNHCKLETAGRLLERSDERHLRSTEEIGRVSCRERVYSWELVVRLRRHSRQDCEYGVRRSTYYRC